MVGLKGTSGRGRGMVSSFRDLYGSEFATRLRSVPSLDRDPRKRKDRGSSGGARASVEGGVVWFCVPLRQEHPVDHVDELVHGENLLLIPTLAHKLLLPP